MMLMPESNLYNKLTLRDLLAELLMLPARFDVRIRDLKTDSRRLEAGDVFIALPGGSVDGRDFIQDAIHAGVAAVLVQADEEWSEPRLMQDVPVIPVTALAQQVGKLASRFFGEPSRHMDVVAITGTNGKTSCAQFLSAGFNLLGLRGAMIGTIGYGLPQSFAESTHTTPDPVSLQRILAELRDQRAETVALEASSHGLEQGRMNGVRVRTAIFTNLSRDHLDYHRSMEEYGAAKLRLFHHPELESAVVNLDDKFGRWIIEQMPRNVGLLTYSRENQAADVHVKKAKQHAHGFDVQVGTPWGEMEFQTSLLGQFNLSNLLAVITVFGLRGHSLSDIENAVAALGTVPGRMELVSGAQLPAVVVDYAHTPDALENVLQALRQHCTGQLWCVFGCGGNRDTGKRPMMGEIATRCADRVIVTDDNPRREDPERIVAEILSGVPADASVVVERNRTQAIRLAITTAAPDDLVVIAGKGHETYQDIDGRKWPFSDVEQASLALAHRRGQS